MKIAPKELAPKDRARRLKVLDLLNQMYPTARCSLDHQTPLQLLVATILSAQCTDQRVNIVTQELFKKYATAADFANTPLKTLEKEIHSTGFYHNKAKNIQAMAKLLVEKHAGKVPDTMEELTALPGVGRKTANVVLGNAFNKNEGVVVDTHVGRISQKLGFTKHADPVKIERDLMTWIPQDQWSIFSHRLVYHGRKLCMARKPACASCGLSTFCPSAADAPLAGQRRSRKSSSAIKASK